MLGDDDLVEVDIVDGSVGRLRPSRAGRAVLVLHARPPDQRSLAHEVERLFWLAGRAAAPEELATGRAEEGDEVAIVRMPVGAVPASLPDHGVDPASIAVVLGETIRPGFPPLQAGDPATLDRPTTRRHSMRLALARLYHAGRIVSRTLPGPRSTSEISA